MKRLNFRFLFILLAVVALLGAAAHFTHAFQERRHANFFLKQADVAAEKKDLAAANEHLNRYLRLRPDDVDAQAKQAMLLADAGAYEPAYNALEKVLRADPSRDAVRRRLVGISMLMQRYRDAQEHLERYLLKKTPGDAELLEQLGQCQAALDAPADAARSFSAAIEAAPQRTSPYLRLANLLDEESSLASREPWSEKNAEYWVAEMVRANPKSADALLARGMYRASKSQHTEALADAKAALAIDAKSLDAHWLAAESARQLKDYTSARRYAAEAQKLDTADPRAYLLLAQIELTDGTAAKALDWLRQGTAAVEKPSDLPVYYAGLLIQEGQIAEAGRQIDQLAAKQYPRPVVGYLRARLAHAQGRWKEAIDGFAEIIPSLTGTPVLLREADYWQGRCYRELGNPEMELAAYRRAIGADSEYLPARAAAAEVLVRLGRYNEAFEEYRQLGASPGAPGASVVEMARCLLLRNLQASPVERRWNEVASLIDRAEAAEPQSPVIALLRAEMFVGQGQLDQADSLLAEAAKKSPKEVSYPSARASLAIRRQRFDDAKKILDDASAVLGDNINIRLVRAALITQTAGDAAGKQLRALAEPTQAMSDENKAALWRGLIPHLAQAGEAAFGIELCRRLGTLEPADLGIRMEMLALATIASDSKAAQEALADIRKIEGEGPTWHYGQAVRLLSEAENGRKEAASEAQRHIDEASKLRPGWSRLSLLAAQVSRIQGNEDRALENYLRAIQRGERDPRIMQQVVLLLYKQQDYLRAGELLKQLEQEGPLTPELTRLRSRIAGQRDDFAEALQPAERVAATSNDYRDHVWLAQVLGVLGQRAKAAGEQTEAVSLLTRADDAFRRAIRMEPGTPDTWVALVDFLQRSGDSAKAAEVLALCEKTVPEPDNARCLAECYLALGQLDNAAAQYEKALEASPDDLRVIRRAAEFSLRNARPQMAKEALERIAEGRLAASSADVQWARRTLALSLQAEGGYANLVGALRLIDRNLADSSASQLDRHVKAVLLAASPSRSGRREAIALLEDVIAMPETAMPEQRFLLAQLYLGEGEWAKASGQFRLLTEPQYVSAYVKALLDRNELNEAALRLATIDREGTQSFATSSLKAELQFRQGRYEQALASLTAFAELPGVPAEQKPIVLLSIARAAEDFGTRLEKTEKGTSAAEPFLAAAEKYYREAAAGDSDRQLMLAAFLARKGQIEEAADLFEKQSDSGSVSMVGMAAQALATAVEPQGDNAARIEKLLRKAAARDDHTAATLMALTELYGRQQQFDEMEKTYRELLAHDPNNAVVLNNLAALLALQRERLDEAETLIDRAIALAGPMAAMLDTRGSVRTMRGEFDAAVADFRAAIDDSPRPTWFFHLALALNRAGRRQEAEQSMQTASRQGLKPGDLHPLEQPDYRALAALLPKGVSN